ncbi:MAG: protein kinase, partial [Bryobacteraceae bacterium]|nr:protein kinase [Bryobacteraceae bacterium]
ERFKREFRKLTGVSHPNVVKLYELLNQGEEWFLTMELLDGADVLDSMRRRPEVLLQLADGLQALHRAGILHRDIKPGNVRVTSGGRLVLLDFGLAHELSPESGLRSRTLALTPAYAAPEQAVSGPLTGAVDWYAVGVILYEALTGSQPFEGTWQEVLRKKQEEDPPAPSGPPHLSALCMQLLHRDPARRAGADEIRKALEGGHAPATPPPREFHLARPGELAVLMGEFHDRTPGARAVRITGKSGMGKTTLALSFLRAAKAECPEAVILTGRCYESEAVPFKTLDELAGEVVRYLKSLPHQEMEALLPRNLAYLARLFPVFRQLPAGTGPTLPEDSFERRRRASAAFRELLGRIAERRPLVLFIDDLQWGDQDSEPFLKDLLFDRENPPMLMLLAGREDDSRVERLPGRRIELGPLASEQALALARALMADDPVDSPRLRAVIGEGEGNPLLIEELAGLALTLPFEEGSRVRLADVLIPRLEALEPAARAMLETICVAQQPVSLEQAARISGAADPMACRNRLLALRLVRSAADDRYEVYHERIRETVTGSIAPRTLREYHRRFAESGSGSALDHYRHMEQAGMPEEAAACALAAAREAWSLLAFDRAANLYQSALRLANPPPEEKADILVRLGEALASAGRGADAAAAYLEAASLSDPLESLRLRTRAADQYLRFGHKKTGTDLMENVLDQAGVSYPRRRWEMWLSLAVHRTRIRMMGRGLERFATRPVDPAAMARIESCWSAAIGFGISDPIRGAEFSARHLIMAHRAGDPYRLALGFAAEATHLAHTSARSDGRVDRMLELARQCALISRSEHAAAFVTAMRAITAFLAGRWREAKQFAESSIQALRDNCTNVNRDLQRTHVFLLSSRFLLGEMKDTGKLLDELVAEARDRGDLFAIEYLPLAAFGYAIYLGRGQVEKALDGIPELPEDGGWGPAQVLAFRARTSVALYLGEGEAAWDMVERHWSAMRRSGYLRLPMLGDFLLGARARCAIAAAASARKPERLLKIALDCAKQMRRSHLAWSRAHGLLAEAGVASCRGDGDRAAQLLCDGEKALEAVEMGLWLAATRYRMGGAHRTAALQWFEQQQVKHPQGFARLILPGRW